MEPQECACKGRKLVEIMVLSSSPVHAMHFSQSVFRGAPFLGCCFGKMNFVSEGG